MLQPRIGLIGNFKDRTVKRLYLLYLKALGIHMPGMYVRLLRTALSKREF